MIVKDIISKIEKTAPLELAYSWDNSGFLIGDIEKDVKKVYLTLDVNVSTVKEAVEQGAELIISHHPILFKGIKKIDYGTPEGFILKELIKNDIALYAAHTNMDTADGGINDLLAQKLGIYDTEIIEQHTPAENCGLGRIGNLKEETTLCEFAELVKKELNTPFVRVCGELDKKIKRVGVGSGACDDIIPDALRMGADVFLTADMKYHISIDSVESGICVIDAGHFPTEVFVMDIFEKLLSEFELDIIRSSNKDIFKFV